jgi:hypothetical protein
VATLPFSVPAIAVVASRSGDRGWLEGLGPWLALVLALGVPAPGRADPLPPAPTPPAATTPAPATAAPARGVELPRSQRVTFGPTTTGAPPAAAGPPAASAPSAPMSEAAFNALLQLSDLDQLNTACVRIVQEDNPSRLRLLQNHLLDLKPAPQPLPVLLANAEVLLTCHGPQAALRVLDRYGPGPGAPRVQWLLMQWRAANAALDHRRAALALQRLTGGSEARLNGLTLPIQRREDGTVVSRSAVDVLAGHLDARGYPEAAGELLLRQAAPGTPGAQRLARAVALLRQLPVAEREAILETALNQAAAAGAWSLVSELLDAQAALPSSRALARRLRLSPRLDDAYGEWLLLREDPAARRRARELEERLRSPRAPGGHAASEAPATPKPTPNPSAKPTPIPSAPSIP